MSVGSVKRQWFNGKGEGYWVICPRVPWVHGSRLGSILIVSFRRSEHKFVTNRESRLLVAIGTSFLGFLQPNRAVFRGEKGHAQAVHTRATSILFHRKVLDGMKKQKQRKAW